MQHIAEKIVTFSCPVYLLLHCNNLLMEVEVKVVSLIGPGAMCSTLHRKKLLQT